MIRRKRLKKEKRVRVRLKKEPSKKSLTGSFTQNCTLQAAVCFEMGYLCDNLSIALDKTIYPNDTMLTERGVKEVLTQVRLKMHEYMVSELVDDFAFWEKCLKVLREENSK